MWRECALVRDVATLLAPPNSWTDVHISREEARVAVCRPVKQHSVLAQSATVQDELVSLRYSLSLPYRVLRV